MSTTEAWAERMLLAEERLGEAYEILNDLKGDLKEAGRKKDAGAIDEAMQRIGRYGQMFGELRDSWTAPAD